MKILLIGPGQGIDIPPSGFGACEKIIWEYYCHLQQLGHEIEFTNTPNFTEMIEKSKERDWDIIHCHFDVFYSLLPQLKANRVCISSHYPYIPEIEHHSYDGYHKIFRFMIENANIYPIFAISEKDRNCFINWGAAPHDVFIMKNGINVSDIKFSENPLWKDKSITLGQISNSRKRQYLTYGIERVHYVGRAIDPINHPNYLGELPTFWKNNSITNFANMVLLSKGENGTCLATWECMAAGLGVVTTEANASELDRSKPWISIVSEEDTQNPQRISEILEQNAEASLNYREEIREYSKTRDWSNLIPIYVENLKRILR